MQTKRTRNLILCSILALVCGVLVAGVNAAQSEKKTKRSSTTNASSNAEKVDLNTAGEKDLDGLPGVGAATAKKIIAGRPYSSVDDLSKAGISASTIKKITPLVTVGAASAATSTSAPAPVAKSSSAKTSQPSPASTSNANPPAPVAPAKASASSATRGAPGSGQVWVNLDSGVYHYENSRYYGKTKNGQYMSEQDAMKAGYHAAKNEKKPQ